MVGTQKIHSFFVHGGRRKSERESVGVPLVGRDGDEKIGKGVESEDRTWRIFPSIIRMICARMRESRPTSVLIFPSKKYAVSWRHLLIFWPFLFPNFLITGGALIRLHFFNSGLSTSNF